MGDVGEVKGPHRLMAELHRGVRLLAGLYTSQKFLDGGRGGSQPSWNFFDLWRGRAPAAVAAPPAGPRLPVNAITAFAKFERPFLPLEDKSPPALERVTVAERPGAGKSRIFEDGAKSVRGLRGLEFIDLAGAISRAGLRRVCEPLDYVDQVGALVGHVAARKVPEIAPVAVTDRVERLLADRSDKPVPIELVGQHVPGPQVDVPVPFRAHQIDLTEHALFDQLLALMNGRGASTLHSDLDDPVSLADLAHHIRALFDRPGHRFFAVSVFAGLDGVHQMIVVPVLGGGDEHGVNIFPFEQLSVVRVAFRLRPRDLEPGFQIHFVNVTDRTPLGPEIFEVFHMATAHAARADDAQNDAVIRPERFCTERRMGEHAEPDRCRAPEKSSPADSVACHGEPP